MRHIANVPKKEKHIVKLYSPRTYYILATSFSVDGSGIYITLNGTKGAPAWGRVAIALSNTLLQHEMKNNPIICRGNIGNGVANQFTL